MNSLRFIRDVRVCGVKIHSKADPNVLIDRLPYPDAGKRSSASPPPHCYVLLNSGPRRVRHMTKNPPMPRNHCSVAYAVPVYVRGDVDGDGGVVLPFPKKARTSRPSHPATQQQHLAILRMLQPKLIIYAGGLQGSLMTCVVQFLGANLLAVR